MGSKLKIGRKLASAGLLAARGLLGLLVLGVSLVPLTALAEATVKVRLLSLSGQPADGVVKLQRGENKYACQTKAGSCEIGGVVGGLYEVTVEQEGKTAPKPKQVMIPPSGDVSLIVRGGE